MAFLWFTDMHHDIVLFTHPKHEEDTNRHIGYNGLQHVAMEVENRDEWLKALADLKRKGVEIISGPLVHGPESQPWISVVTAPAPSTSLTRTATV